MAKNSKITTIIVDDEPLARARVKKLLAAHIDIHVLAECRNGTEAISAVKLHKPDLMFLDIQMPDLNGFEVLNELQLQVPHTIFITAYDQYAVRAFEVHAIDYLLKPYDSTRFDDAIQQARNQLKIKKAESFNQRLMNLMHEFNYKTQNKQEAFAIKHQGREVFIHPDQVIYFEADGNYIKIHINGRYYLERMTMQSLQEMLPEHQFMRIHRSYLVNTDFIAKIQYTGNSEYKIALNNGIKLLSGRTYKSQIVEYLNRTL